MVHPSPLLRALVVKSFSESQMHEAHRVLAGLLLTGGPARRAEAVWHLMRVGPAHGSTAAKADLPKNDTLLSTGLSELSEADAAKLKTVVCDWDVFVLLKKADLVILATLIPGGALSIHRDLSGGTAEQQILLAKFLSAAGECILARKELAEAREKLSSRALGLACLEMALNEVRSRINTSHTRMLYRWHYISLLGRCATGILCAIGSLKKTWHC